MSYELQLNILRSCVYCTSYELRFAYELPVTVYCTSYELLLLHELRVIVYCTRYELLFITRVTSYFLHTSYGLIFICEWRVTYNKKKDDKAVYDNKVMLKNYLRSLFDEELGAR